MVQEESVFAAWQLAIGEFFFYKFVKQRAAAGATCGGMLQLMRTRVHAPQLNGWIPAGTYMRAALQLAQPRSAVAARRPAAHVSRHRPLSNGHGQVYDIVPIATPQCPHACALAPVLSPQPRSSGCGPLLANSGAAAARGLRGFCTGTGHADADGTEWFCDICGHDILGVRYDCKESGDFFTMCPRCRNDETTAHPHPLFETRGPLHITEQTEEQEHGQEQETVQKSSIGSSASTGGELGALADEDT